MNISKNLVVRNYSERILIFQNQGELQNRSLLELNETAAFIWKEMVNLSLGWVDLERSLILAILDEFDISEAEAQSDIKNFFFDLKQLGVIE